MDIDYGNCTIITFYAVIKNLQLAKVLTLKVNIKLMEKMLRFNTVNEYNEFNNNENEG